MSRMKLILAALAATVILSSLAAAPAIARSRVEFTPGGAIRMAARSLTFESESVDVICDVTLDGTLQRLIAKVRGALAGGIRAITIANPRSTLGTSPECRWLAPMHIQYHSITGTLPTITGGLLQLQGGLLIGLTILGFIRIRCLFEGILQLGSTENVAGIRRLRVLGAEGQTFTRVTDLNGSGQCPTREELRFVGTFDVTPTQRIVLLER